MTVEPGLDTGTLLDQANSDFMSALTNLGKTGIIIPVPLFFFFFTVHSGGEREAR